MVAQTHRVRHVSFRAYTAFVGPYSLFWTEKDGNRELFTDNNIYYISMKNKHTEKNRALLERILSGQPNNSHFSWASGQRRVRRGSLWIQLKHTPFWNDLCFDKWSFGSIYLFFFHRGLLLKIQQTETATHATLAVSDLKEKREIHLFQIIGHFLWFKGFKTWVNNMQRFENQDKISLALHLNE